MEKRTIWCPEMASSIYAISEFSFLGGAYSSAGTQPGENRFREKWKDKDLEEDPHYDG